MDIKSKEARSLNMSAIKDKNTKPEIMIRKILYGSGFRYRLYSSSLPGKPDIFLPKYRTAVFVHGCFWHRHKDCKYAYLPKSNIDFWLKKFDENIERDKAKTTQLLQMNIKIIIIWECTIKKLRTDEQKSNFLRLFNEALNSHQLYVEI